MAGGRYADGWHYQYYSTKLMTAAGGLYVDCDMICKISILYISKSAKLDLDSIWHAHIRADMDLDIHAECKQCKLDKPVST